MIKKEITWYKPSEKLPETYIKYGKEITEGLLLLYKYEIFEKPLRYIVAYYFPEINDKKEVWMQWFTKEQTYLEQPDYWSYLKDSYPESFKSDKQD